MNLCNQSIRTCDQGVGRFGVLMFVLFSVAGIWAGFQVLPFYYSQEELKGHMHAQVKKASLFRDDQIRKNLWKSVRELGIPLEDPEEIRINRFDGKIVIETSYEEVLYLELGEFGLWSGLGDAEGVWDIHIFSFNPTVSGTY